MDIPIEYPLWGIIVTYMLMFAHMIWESKSKGDKLFSIFIFGFWCAFIGFMLAVNLYQYTN